MREGVGGGLPTDPARWAASLSQGTFACERQEERPRAHRHKWASSLVSRDSGLNTLPGAGSAQVRQRGCWARRLCQPEARQLTEPACMYLLSGTP